MEVTMGVQTNKQKIEEYKFINQDQQHEYEIKHKNEKFTSVINKLNKESLVQQGENSINFLIHDY